MMNDIFKPVFVLLCVFLFAGVDGNAQVGVGTVSPQGSLEVSSTTDGLLIPRVALSATNVATIVTPTVSELVYNTFTSAAGPNQVVPGFYYWNGSLWVPFSNSTTKMFSGSYIVPGINDATTKNLVTLAQTGGWVVDLVGTGVVWEQRFRIANTNTFSLSGTNTMLSGLSSDISGGNTVTANRIDILYQKDVTSTPFIGYGSFERYLQQGTIEAWTNDGSSKMTLNWWGVEYMTHTIRWNITITNR